jgi:NADPH-dependent 2,4-dienoyl-CoA reductase/sulfur reductase-like enzyme
LTQKWDAVVVGGGHNGLVAAAYLARAGMRTLVLERRHVLGGAAVTEEIVPGFRFSVASYVVSLLRPEIVRELELPRHGLHILPLDGTFTPLDDDFLWRTDDHGRFMVRGTNPFASSGVVLEAHRGSQVVDERTPVTADGPERPELVISRDFAVAIAGRVVDQSGDPMADITVAIEQLHRSAETDIRLPEPVQFASDAPIRTDAVSRGCRGFETSKRLSSPVPQQDT